MLVVGIDFGTISTGYLFSWKHEWRKVHNTYMYKKTSPALLLRPDKSLIAFGYEAKSIFMNLKEESLPELDSGSDSNSQEEAEHVKKNTFREHYYFSGFDMFLRNENVSLLVFL